ncbi:MAG: nucleotidyl transferase AbiEii/AbiGii toxin family protein [Candidatus Hodarchaeota archaeon]
MKFEELIIQIHNLLKEMNIDFIFSGAIAANVYRTTPRATMDIDIAIPFKKQILEKIKETFKDFEFEDWNLLEKRLEIKKKYPDVIVPEHLRLKHSSGYEIDFFPLYSNYLSNKRKAKVMNLEIDVIGPEDLILLKSLFNRYKDRDDVLNIIENFNLKLNLDYLIRELKEIERDEIINLIKKIRSDQFTDK